MFVHRRWRPEAAGNIRSVFLSPEMLCQCNLSVSESKWRRFNVLVYCLVLFILFIAVKMLTPAPTVFATKSGHQGQNPSNLLITAQCPPSPPVGNLNSAPAAMANVVMILTSTWQWNLFASLRVSMVSTALGWWLCSSLGPPSYLLRQTTPTKWGHCQSLSCIRVRFPCVKRFYSSSCDWRLFFRTAIFIVAVFGLGVQTHGRYCDLPLNHYNGRGVAKPPEFCFSYSVLMFLKGSRC